MSAILVGLAFSAYFEPQAWSHRGNAILAATAFFFLLGLWDDVSKLPEKMRLGVQAAAAAVMAVAGLRLEALKLPWATEWILPTPVSILLTVVWICGFVNLFNFMDGVDGIAAAEAALAGLFIHAMTGLIWPLLASASAVGFLVFNLPPSQIFMGDSGSYALGFLLAISCLAPMQPGGSRLPFPAFLLVFAAFVMDTAVTLLRRYIKGEDWLRAHRSHYYQKLTNFGWSHLRVTALYTAATMILGFSALLYVQVDSFWQSVLIVSALAFFASFFSWIHAREAAPH